MPRVGMKRAVRRDKQRADAVKLVATLPYLETRLSSGEVGDRALPMLRKRVLMIRRALGMLTEEERQVLLILACEKGTGAADRLCGMIGCEKSTVYRLRKKALDKFCLSIYGE